MLLLHQIIPYVLEKIKLMKIDSKIRDEKLQYDTNREAAKLSALSSGKIMMNMNILQVKKYYLMIKEEWYNQVSFHIFH